MKAIRDNTILKREPKPAGLYTDKRPKTNIQKKQNLYFFIIFILLLFFSTGVAAMSMHTRRNIIITQDNKIAVPSYNGEKTFIKINA